jgi:hypothetical protein
MRRAVAVAAFSLVLAVPVAWSQRGGARGGGGGHSAGMSRGPGFSSTAGMHSASGSFHGCFNCGHVHTHFSNSFVRFYSPRYRYPRYAYGYGYYWPWYWDTSSYDHDDSSYPDASRQIDDLNQQVQQLREQLDASQYEPARYGPPAPSRQTESGTQPARENKNAEKLPAQQDLATVLVFRDQRIQEVKNYAIVGKTLVVIADARQRKIPLADLDLEATSKLNEERGVDFQLPR